MLEGRSLDPNCCFPLIKNYSVILSVGRRSFNWNKVFKSGPSKICGRQPLKILLGSLLNTLPLLSELIDYKRISQNYYWTLNFTFNKHLSSTIYELKVKPRYMNVCVSAFFRSPFSFDWNAVSKIYFRYQTK